MKDARGHGSNSGLTSKQGPAPRMPVRGNPKKLPGAQTGSGPMSSNAQAAQSLMSKLKSTQAPIHSAMSHPAMPSGNHGSSS